MQDSDAEQGKNGEESENDETTNRKQRMTPRQLWESRRQQAENEEASRRLNVRPIDAEDEEEAETTDTEEASGADRSTSFATAEEKAGEEPEPSPPTEEPVERAMEEDQPGEGELAQPQEPSEGVSGDAPAESETPESDEPEETPRMVDEEKQPGLMRYPYATHGPAPDEGSGKEDSERVISSSFVLGALIIIGALLIGLALVAVHKRLDVMDQRIEQLERTVAEHHGLPTAESSDENR